MDLNQQEKKNLSDRVLVSSCCLLDGLVMSKGHVVQGRTWGFRTKIGGHASNHQKPGFDLGGGG